MNRENKFFRDYLELRKWAASEGFKLVNHRSLHRLASGKTDSIWPKVVAELGGDASFVRVDDIARCGAVEVVVMLGCQFGLGLPARILARPHKARFVAIASLSVLSGQYSGIVVYRLTEASLEVTGLRWGGGDRLMMLGL